MFGFRSQHRWVFAAFAVSILFLCYVVDRTDFGQVALGYSLAFYGYYFWMEKDHFRNLREILTYAVIMRLLLIASTPLLSDDYFRFIWDGLVQCQGINPFNTIPNELQGISPYMEQIRSSMNSPVYYSVYPPVMQWLFHGISLLVGESTIGQVISMRLLLILSDIGVIWLGAKILKMLGRSVREVALYALNPLVIVELTGNLHFEGMMLCFTLLGVYFLMLMLRDKKYSLVLAGALGIALGVLTKMVLLLSIPAMWRRWGALRTMLIGSLSLVFIGIGFSFFIDQTLLSNLGQSLDLYFRNFEFNSSVFTMVREVSTHWIPHYTVELVGPYITLAMVLGILLLAFFRKAQDFESYFETLLFILSIHLLFASTVHPWYIVNLVGVAMFTRYRYPMIWSFAALLSYFMYSNDLVEVWWITSVEYVAVLAYFLWERQKVRSSSSPMDENP